MQFTIDHLRRVKAKAIDQAFEKNISANTLSEINQAFKIITIDIGLPNPKSRVPDIIGDINLRSLNSYKSDYILS